MSPNLPNQITALRLVLAVIFFVLLSPYSAAALEPATWRLDVALGVFLIAAFTDILDGHLARKYNVVSALGRILDPVADKVLVCGAYILFAGPAFVDATGNLVTHVQDWMVVVIVARELLVTALRGFVESTGRDFSASLQGKLKMWMQSITAVAILFLVAHGTALMSAQTADWIMIVLTWTTTIVTALSMTSYIVRAAALLRGGQPA